MPCPCWVETCLSGLINQIAASDGICVVCRQVSFRFGLTINDVWCV
jgi:hypothetical protein